MYGGEAQGRATSGTVSGEELVVIQAAQPQPSSPGCVLNCWDATLGFNLGH